MKAKITCLTIVFCLLQIACGRQKQQQNNFSFKRPTVVEAKTYKVPREKMAQPIVVPATGVKTVPAGKPEIIQLKSNVFPAKPGRAILTGATVLGLKDTTAVKSILEDSKGNLWFATNNNGLFKYDGEYVSQFTANSSLSSQDLN